MIAWQEIRTFSAAIAAFASVIGVSLSDDSAVASVSACVGGALQPCSYRLLKPFLDLRNIYLLLKAMIHQAYVRNFDFSRSPSIIGQFENGSVFHRLLREPCASSSSSDLLLSTIEDIGVQE